MKDFGPQLAIWGVLVGLLTFLAGLLGVPAMLGPSPFVWKVWAGMVLGSYAVLPIAGLIYDLKSGDFERREGYKP